MWNRLDHVARYAHTAGYTHWPAQKARTQLKHTSPVGCQVGATAKQQNLPEGTWGTKVQQKSLKISKHPPPFFFSWFFFPQRGLRAEEGVIGDSGRRGSGAKPIAQSRAQSTERWEEASSPIPIEQVETQHTQGVEGCRYIGLVSYKAEKGKEMGQDGWLAITETTGSREHRSRGSWLNSLCVGGGRLLSREAQASRTAFMKVSQQPLSGHVESLGSGSSSTTCWLCPRGKVQMPHLWSEKVRLIGLLHSWDVMR